MRWIIALALSVYLESFSYGQQQKNLEGSIIVTIVGLRNNGGNVQIALFRSKDGFPGDPGKVLRKQMCRIENRSCRTSFDGIDYGEYAISTIHDENGNGELDTGILGIPKEGYGASNNAKGFMGPPKYEDAKFILDSDSLHIEITMNY